MQIAILFLLTLVLAFSSGCANSTETMRIAGCNSEKYSDAIRATEAEILARGIVMEPNDLIRPGQPYACVVIAFSISGGGLATDKKVLEVYPSRVFSDSALIALDGYRFKAGDKVKSGILLFEAELQMPK